MLFVVILVKNGMIDGWMFLGIVVVEKCGVVLEVFEWISDWCIMCNECVFVCFYVVIWLFLVDEEEMIEVLEGFIVCDLCGVDGLKYCI